MEIMKEEPIKVYVKINENNMIVDVCSSVFLKDSHGWIEIDSGFGDRFAHAQNQYFSSPLMDDLGNYLIEHSTKVEENVENSSEEN